MFSACPTDDGKPIKALKQGGTHNTHILARTKNMDRTPRDGSAGYYTGALSLYIGRNYNQS